MRLGGLIQLRVLRKAEKESCTVRFTVLHGQMCCTVTTRDDYRHENVSMKIQNITTFDLDTRSRSICLHPTLLEGLNG